MGVVYAIGDIVREGNPIAEILNNDLANEIVENLPPVPLEPEPS
jgi:hypothetical protein